MNHKGVDWTSASPLKGLRLGAQPRGLAGSPELSGEPGAGGRGDTPLPSGRRTGILGTPQDDRAEGV